VSEAFRSLLGSSTGEPLALLHGGGVGPTWLCRDPIATLTCGAGEWQSGFDRLDAFLAEHCEHRTVGWLGYDLALDIEQWQQHVADDFEVPVLHMTAYRDVREFSAVDAVGAPAVPRATNLRATIAQADYERRVAAVVEHIKNGDIFQANLTQPFTANFDGDPRALFWRLCEQSPAPFAAYIEDGNGTAVLSSSPEEFLWRKGSALRTRPIKGTRPRGDDAVEDARLLQELLDSEKDQAELAMIVDLLRNDLGKVAEVGSVQVGAFPEHASFAQVHHLFATVTAQLRTGVSTVDLLRATFPGGSITGCPKLRCLEIIEQLEVARRGIYTGAIGWFGPGDEMHCNIAIRTMVHKAGRIRGNAGGGITALSDPYLEWCESLAKMAGLERALQATIQPPSNTDA
jgi:para-aminobenzoate synthetase component 1